MQADDTQITKRSRTDSFTREGWAKDEARRSIAFHVMMRLVTMGAIARTKGALRLASQLALRAGKYRGLLAHRFADTHLHALLNGTRAEAGMFARVVESALRRVLRLNAPFERCHIRAIHDERHLLHVLRYILRQEVHHGTAFDEAHDGSSLPELLGMRLGAEWLAPRVQAALPRVHRQTILGWLELPDLETGDADLALLAEAAAAAWGVGSLEGSTARHARAKRAAVHLLDRLAPRMNAARAVGIPHRSAARYRKDRVDEAELRAVERQLRLRTHLSRRGAASEEVGLADPPHLASEA